MLKRLIDILLATAGLVLFWPALMVAAIGIRISSPGPIMFLSERVGLRGRRFMMYKLRTMHVEEGRNNSPITAANDSRIFHFGFLLRLTKLDELPQLLNVLYGDMSLVGPRPLSPGIVDTLYSSAELTTLDVRPGLSSPGSIYNYTHCELLVDPDNREHCFRHRVLPLRLALEQVYLIKSSIVYDFQIIMRTVVVITLKVLGKTRFSEPREMAAVRRMMRAFDQDGGQSIVAPEIDVGEAIETPQLERALLIGPEEVAKWIPKEVRTVDGRELNIVSRVEPQRYSEQCQGNRRNADDTTTGLSAHVDTLDRSFGFGDFLVTEDAIPGWEFHKLWQHCRERNRRIEVLSPKGEDVCRVNDMVATRRVNVRDLFGVQRRPSAESGLENEIVAVTGAGSTAGREIVRRISSTQVGQLHVIDGSEDSLARLQSELRGIRGVNLSFSLMDDGVEEAVERTMRRIKPTILIHAGCQFDEGLAAKNVSETILFNLFAVTSVVHAAERAGCKQSVVLVSPRTPSATSPLGAVTRIVEQQLMGRATDRAHDVSRYILRAGRLMDSPTGVIQRVEDGIQRGDGIRVSADVLDDSMCTCAGVVANAVMSVLEQANGSGVFAISEDAMWDRMEVIRTTLEFHEQSLPIILDEAGVDAIRLRDEYSWSARPSEFDAGIDAILLPEVEQENLQRVVERLAKTHLLSESEAGRVLQESALEFRDSDDSPTVPFNPSRIPAGDRRHLSSADAMDGQDTAAEAKLDA